MLLLEYQEATDDLAHLEDRAKGLAGRLREVADWVEESTFPDFLRKPSIIEHHRKLLDDATSAPYSEAMDFEKAKDAVAAVMKARAKVEGLKDRKSGLSIK
jgi:hypothetical protein